jgi:heme/copper-type cytochrome/quinol oxidase subunit 2
LGETTIKTTIRNQRFVPDEIHLKAEEPVIFQIVNEDRVPVEFESSDLNKEKMVMPGKTLELKFKGLKPGSYEFFSDFGPKTLRGRIIVE